MATAVIKLNPLADPVWTTTQDDNFLTLRRARLTFGRAHDGRFVSGVHVRRLGLKFGSAGIDALELCDHAKVLAGAAYVVFVAAR